MSAQPTSAMTESLLDALRADLGLTVPDEQWRVIVESVGEMAEDGTLERLSHLDPGERERVQMEVLAQKFAARGLTSQPVTSHPEQD